LGRWDWLLVSIVVGTFASLARWFVARTAASGSAAGQVAERALATPWISDVLRIVYAVGIPAAALFGQSALSARGLGLKSLPAPGDVTPLDGLLRPTWEDWAGDVGWMAGIGAAFWLLVTLGDHAARHLRSSEESGKPDPHSGAAQSAVVDAVVHQVHWAFYREPFIFAWGAPLGIWLGALPVLFEAVINPRFWERLNDEGPPAVRRCLVRAGLFVATGLVMIRTQNLWMGLGLDLLVGWLARRTGPSALGLMHTEATPTSNAGVGTLPGTEPEVDPLARTLVHSQ